MVKVGASLIRGLGLALLAWNARASAGVDAGELRPGDVLLNPLRCYVCEAIEKEEGSIYSHSGVVVPLPSGELGVAQALAGSVSAVPLAEFRRYTQRGQSIRVVRPREWAALSEEESAALGARLASRFAARFQGLPIDGEYRWNNADASGRELLYCSEFVAKFLSPLLSTPFTTKPMHYDVLGGFWTEFFRGNVPAGEPGISPTDLLRWSGGVSLGDLS